MKERLPMEQASTRNGLLPWLSWLVSLGIDETVSGFDAQRIRTGNVAVLIGLGVSLTTGLVEGPAVLPGALTFAATVAVVLVLQSRKRAVEATVLVVVTAALLIGSESYTLGADFGVHFWMLPLILFPFLLFPRRSKRLPPVLGGVLVVVFGFLAHADQQSHRYADTYLVTQILAAFMLLVLAATMRSLLLSAENSNDRNNSLLSEQADQVRSLNEQLARALEHERELSRLKETFLASLSHELRTPLNAVMGLSEALEEEVYGPLTSEQRDSLQVIWRSGSKLLTMFDNLLDFSRIGAGSFPTRIQEIDLRECLDVVAWQKRGALTEAGLQFEMSDNEQGGMVMADQGHVIRIANNLLDNAIKFTPKGGRVGIDICVDESSEVVEFSVWDTGIGIAPDRHAELFEPFVQLEHGHTRRFGGTGLGLALVGRIARLLAAELSVESVEGEGSRFTVRLSRDVPCMVEIFSDLRCPSCFVLNEWLDESNLSHLVRWRGVEQMPTMTRELGGSPAIRERLAKELKRVGAVAPGVRMEQPKQVSNTRRALAALERVRCEHPARAPEARRTVYRAIWHDKRDVTDWPAVVDVLPGFGVEQMDDSSPEMEAVVAATTEWRRDGQNRIPMLKSAAGTNQWHGLGQRAELMAFVGAELDGFAADVGQ
jgi:signal transduction histidine kinase